MTYIDLSKHISAKPKLRAANYFTIAIAFAFVLSLLTNSASAVVLVHENDVEKLTPEGEHANTTRNIVDALASRHYVNTELDDQLSSKIFTGYLADLDPSRSYFLASDINSFQKFKFQLDNALRKGDVAPAFEIFNVYHERVISRFEKVIAQLESGVDKYDFTIDEGLLLDRSEVPWAENEAELDDIWRKRVKHAVLNLRLTDKEPEKIQELLVKRYLYPLLVPTDGGPPRIWHSAKLPCCLYSEPNIELCSCVSETGIVHIVMVLVRIHHMIYNKVP